MWDSFNLMHCAQKLAYGQHPGSLSPCGLLFLLYAHMLACVHICMYVCMYVCIYVYTYVHRIVATACGNRSSLGPGSFQLCQGRASPPRARPSSGSQASGCTIQPGLSLLNPFQQESTDRFTALLHGAVFGIQRIWDLFSQQVDSTWLHSAVLESSLLNLVHLV